jgi:hypothetical protein
MRNYGITAKMVAFLVKEYAVDEATIETCLKAVRGCLDKAKCTQRFDYIHCIATIVVECPLFVPVEEEGSVGYFIDTYGFDEITRMFGMDMGPADNTLKPKYRG